MRILIIIVFFFLTIPEYCQVNAGDTLEFWSVSYIDWQPDPPIEQRIINAICYETGEHCYFFIDTLITSLPSPSQIDHLVNLFDTSFIPTLSQLYGSIPDEFDNDPRVYIIIVPNEGWTGYFDPAHQMADSLVWDKWSKHSNQKEIIYLSDDVFNYEPEITLAHELGHMIHWGRDHSPEPPVNPVIYWEDMWIDESFATFAPVFLLEDISQQDVYDYLAFFSYDPDISLINFADYNEVKLWMTFMWEHYGAENFITTLINEQANGIEGIINTLSALGYTESFNEVFEQWVISNFLDNKIYLGGKYGYYHYNFPPCLIYSTHNHYPTGIRTGSVSSYAADYITFTSTAPGDITIYFDGTDSSEFRLSFLKLGSNNSQIYSIESIKTDSLNNACFHFDSLGMQVEKIIMIVMNTDTTIRGDEKISYTYNAERILGVDNDSGTELCFKLWQNYPNPFNGTTLIRYSLPQTYFVRIKIFNILGRQVASLINEEKSAGDYKLTLDAEALSSGVYFYQIQAGSFIETRKMILLR